MKVNASLVIELATVLIFLFDFIFKYVILVYKQKLYQITIISCIKILTTTYHAKLEMVFLSLGNIKVA